MASIQGIYVALFGRPADPAGLAYFNGLTNNGANLAGIANLAGQPEYTARFAGMSNTQIINSIYQSLFGRDGETAGVNFWLEKLTSGALTINSIAIAILDGAQGADKTTIDAKIAAADLFTTHLDLPAEQNAYNTTTSALIKTYLASINTTKPATGTEIDAVIQAMLTSGGQAPGGGDGGSDGNGTATPPTGDMAYSGDVLLLKDSTTLKSYQYSDFTHGIQDAVMQVAADASKTYTDTNVVLINNMTPINLLIGQQLSMVTSVVEQLIPSYHEWQPDSLFLNIFNKDSAITGTSGDDVVLVLGGDETSHTVTGGRGNDVIVVAGIDGGLGLPGMGIPLMGIQQVADEGPTEEGPTVGTHMIDGGADDDIIINVGGDNNDLKGGSGIDVILSIGHANDRIDGGTGADFIFGGDDHGRDVFYTTLMESPTFAEPDFSNGDVLTGGDGKDMFLYVPEGQIGGSAGPLQMLGLASNGADTITDFKTTEDKIGIFVADNESFDYQSGTGFAGFTDAADAAVIAFNSGNSQASVIEGPTYGMHFFFAANVDGDGYLFVDDNANTTIDFVIKLEGLTADDQFNAGDIKVINVLELINTIGGGAMPAFDFAAV